ncbi:hypothetical protein FNF28_00832 [Cafeteria roenbergensis]|uniref:Vacuolar protein-sorting-associated protein 36 n=1 Tax=Cafeteria roenbergensis TaxID=33653 RepID=A0A5A8E5Z1_CAFRO|nr:hypothetical protein FNF28_00832 [Cafeteria roenbergensis]
MELGSSPSFDASGALAFLASEGELLRDSQPRVDLYVNGDKVMDRRGGEAVVTTHRVLFLHSSRPALSTAWPLELVKDVRFIEASWFKSAKVVLSLVEDPPAGEDGAAAAAAAPRRRAEIMLSFQAGAAFAKAFLAKLRSSLSERSWVKETAEPAPKRAKEMLLGIGGLRQAHANRLATERAMVDEAFSDINSLEKHARAMVALVRRFKAKQAREAEAGGAAEAAAPAAAGAGAGAGAGAAAGGGAPSRLDSVMADLGIANPVTKQSAGQRYHKELAAQLAVVMRPYLARAGGVLLLSEAYCRYNRARGTDLVSPDDVMQASLLMGDMDVGMSLQRLQSGVLVLQGREHDAARAVTRLRALLASRLGAADSAPKDRWAAAFVGTAELAALWRVSLPVAQSLIEKAEDHGVVWRDDSLHGVRYYLAPELADREASGGGGS